MNPYLLALAIGLFLLNFTCLIALEISAPQSLGVETTAAARATR